MALLLLNAYQYLDLFNWILSKKLRFTFCIGRVIHIRSTKYKEDIRLSPSQWLIQIEIDCQSKSTPCYNQFYFLISRQTTFHSTPKNNSVDCKWSEKLGMLSPSPQSSGSGMSITQLHFFTSLSCVWNLKQHSNIICKIIFCKTMLCRKSSLIIHSLLLIVCVKYFPGLVTANDIVICYRFSNSALY